MAIINCPQCSKKTSEISSRCPHCGFDREQEGDERQRELMRRELRDRVYHLKMTSYGVISLLLAAFGWYWWDTSGFQNPTSRGPIILSGLAAMAYVVVRVLLFKARRLLKQFSR